MATGTGQHTLSPRERLMLRLVDQGRINAVMTGFMFFRANPDGSNAEMLSPLDRKTVGDFVDTYFLMFDGIQRCRAGTERFLATRVALTEEGKHLLHHNSVTPHPPTGSENLP